MEKHKNPEPIPNRLLKPIKNSRGIALMMAIFVMTLLTFLAVEVSYRTSVENNLSIQGVSRVRAYYAAKAAIELSLFRIFVYKKVMAGVADKLGQNKFLLDPIWQFPFMWPPPVPNDLNGVDKAKIKEAVKESKMKATYSVTIDSEGNKIDLNDLASESKEIVKATKDQILQIFQTELSSNAVFADRYGSFNFEELINNMIDWVDEDNVGLNGGDEKSLYTDFHSSFIPPNAPFKTLKELHMVEGMTDEIFQVLAPRSTVFGAKGVNINYADKSILKSLDPQLNDDVVAKIIERRGKPQEGGPFGSLKDFYSYLQSIGVKTDTFNQAKIPLIFDAELNFRIKATGEYGRVTRSIEVITFDVDNLKERYISILTKAKKDNTEGTAAQDPSDTAKKPDVPATQTGTSDKADKDSQADTIKLSPPKGRPNIVYWNED